MIQPVEKTIKETDKKFYRYESYGVSSGSNIYLLTFDLIRETPCGWWIGNRFSTDTQTHYHDRNRWVSKTSRKKYAYPSIVEAMMGFKYRKLSQVGILKAQLEDAEGQLKAIHNALEKVKSQILQADERIEYPSSLRSYSSHRHMLSV